MGTTIHQVATMNDRVPKGAYQLCSEDNHTAPSFARSGLPITLPSICQLCELGGHLAPECWKLMPKYQDDIENDGEFLQIACTNSLQRNLSYIATFNCYTCGERGHLQRNCPNSQTLPLMSNSVMSDGSSRIGSQIPPPQLMSRYQNLIFLH